MAAYVIARVEITDPVAYEEYRQGVPASLTPYGGRFLARGGATEVVEGDEPLRRVVILEFPSMAQLKAWYDSPEYVPLRDIRWRTARSTIIFTEGV